MSLMTKFRLLHVVSRCFFFCVCSSKCSSCFQCFLKVVFVFWVVTGLDYLVLGFLRLSSSVEGCFDLSLCFRMSQSERCCLKLFGVFKLLWLVLDCFRYVPIVFDLFIQCEVVSDLFLVELFLGCLTCFVLFRFCSQIIFEVFFSKKKPRKFQVELFWIISSGRTSF